MNRSRSKRAVLYGIASVVALNLGLNLLIEDAKPEYRDPEFGHRLRDLRREVTASPDSRPVVVVLGSSRTEMGFNPAELGLGTGPDSPLVYNLSQAGCGPVGEVLNLRRLLAAGIKPDGVLVEILPPVLGGAGSAERLLVQQQLGYQDMRSVEPYLTDPDAYWRQWRSLRVNPWHTYRVQLLNHWGASSFFPWQQKTDFLWKQLKRFGWLPYFYTEDDYRQEQREQGTAQARAEYVPYFADFRIAPLPERAYRDLVATCREHGIRVAFYTMPEADTFRAIYPPGARQLIDAYFDRLRADGCPVFDCSGWLPAETWFADSHHLMQHGSKAFSNRFGRECLGPWIGVEKKNGSQTGDP